MTASAMRVGSSRPWSHRGFSLVELLVVVAVIGSIFLLSLTAASAVLPRWRVDRATRDIASALTAARARAILERTQVAMPFDTTRRLYVLAADGASSGVVVEGGLRYSRLPGSVDFCTPDGAAAVTFAPPAAPHETVAVFDTAGLLRSNVMPSSVHVCDASKSEYRRIRVSPVGTVNVTRWTGSTWQ